MDTQEVQNTTAQAVPAAPKVEGSSFKTANKDAFKESSKSVLKYTYTCLLVLLVLLISCIGGSYIFKYAMNRVRQNVEDSLPFSNRSEREKEEQKFDKPEKKSEAVIVGKVEWKLTDAKEVRNSLKAGSDDEAYCKPGEDTKYVLITYTIRNVDRAFVTVPKDQVDIYDNKETKYTPSTKVYKCVLGEDSLTDRYAPDILKRDEKKEYTELFEVPKNSKGFRMKVGDFSVLGKEFNYISLGF